jgi:hypothetical protein
MTLLTLPAISNLLPDAAHARRLNAKFTLSRKRQWRERRFALSTRNNAALSRT